MVYYGGMCNYYSVFNGRKIGVFTDHYEAVLSVHGYPNNCWEGFGIMRQPTDMCTGLTHPLDRNLLVQNLLLN